MLVFVATSGFYVYLALFIVELKSLSSGAINELGTKHLQLNNPLFITGKYIKSLLTIVTPAASLGVPSEHQIVNYTVF